MKPPCQVHPTGEEAPESNKKFDGKWWCKPCFKATVAEIKRRAKAAGLPSNPVIIRLAMMKVGASGGRAPPEAAKLLKGMGK